MRPRQRPPTTLSLSLSPRVPPTQSEGGAFTGDNAQYYALNELALRAGCPWVDLEQARNGPELKAFAAKAKRLHTRLIGSNHVLGPMPSTKELGAALRRCELGGADSVHTVRAQPNAMRKAVVAL